MTSFFYSCVLCIQPEMRNQSKHQIHDVFAFRTYFKAPENVHRRGIEPRSPAWQARILPLNHRCGVVGRLAIFGLLLCVDFISYEFSTCYIATEKTIKMLTLIVIYNGAFCLKVFWFIPLKHFNTFCLRNFICWKHLLIKAKNCEILCLLITI